MPSGYEGQHVYRCFFLNLAALQICRRRACGQCTHNESIVYMCPFFKKNNFLKNVFFRFAHVFQLFSFDFFECALFDNPLCKVYFLAQRRDVNTIPQHPPTHHHPATPRPPSWVAVVPPPPAAPPRPRPRAACPPPAPPPQHQHKRPTRRRLPRPAPAWAHRSWPMPPASPWYVVVW